MPKLTPLALSGMFSKGSSRWEPIRVMYIFIGLEPAEDSGLSCFGRIVVLFFRHKGTQEVNHVRSLEEAARGHGPSASGWLKPWPSYTSFVKSVEWTCHFYPLAFGYKLIGFTNSDRSPHLKSLSCYCPWRREQRKKIPLRLRQLRKWRRSSAGSLSHSGLVARSRVPLAMLTGFCYSVSTGGHTHSCRCWVWGI